MELRVGRHVTLARPKEENVALRVEDDLAGAASKAKGGAVALEGLDARLGADVEVDGDGRVGRAPRHTARAA